MHVSAKNEHGPLRIGAVTYLNSKPLIEGLATHPDVQLTLDLPSRLADALAGDALDVALIPSVEVLRNNYAIVSDACIACRGPVLSVRLFFRVPPERVETMAIDEGSRTSGVLARILIQNQLARQPAIEIFPIGMSVNETRADAVLLIGDRAMQKPDGSFVEIWDLGERWCQAMDLPFVFAVWAARPGETAESIKEILNAARDRGIRNIDTIVAKESERVGLAPDRCRQYLSQHLHFTLGKSEQQALVTFYQQARELNLVPPGWEL